MEFTLAHGKLDPDVEERVNGQDFPITNLKRLLDSAYVTEQMELDRGETYLTTTANKKWVLSMLREFITIISREEYNNQKFGVRDIYDAAAQKRFFNKLEAKHPKPERSARRWAINADTTVADGEPNSQRKKKRNRPTSERKKLVPKNTDVRPPMGRANDILHELQRLEVDNFRNAVSVLFRVFLEFSVEEYMTRRAVPGVASGDKLYQKMKAVTKHLEDNGIMSHKDLISANKVANDPNSVLSTQQLNAYVHNQNFYPSSSELKRLGTTLNRSS